MKWLQSNASVSESILPRSRQSDPILGPVIRSSILLPTYLTLTSILRISGLTRNWRGVGGAPQRAVLRLIVIIALFLLVKIKNTYIKGFPRLAPPLGVAAPRVNRIHTVNKVLKLTILTGMAP